MRDVCMANSLVWQISGVPSRVPVQFRSVAEALFTHVALIRPLACNYGESHIVYFSPLPFARNNRVVVVIIIINRKSVVARCSPECHLRCVM